MIQKIQKMFTFDHVFAAVCQDIPSLIFNPKASEYGEELLSDVESGMIIIELLTTFINKIKLGSYCSE